MKVLMITVAVLLMSCSSKVQTEFDDYKSPDKEFLWNLRKDACNAIHDSIAKYVLLYVTRIYDKRDSAYYYRGKVDAFFSSEKIIWPIYPNDYPHPSK